MKGQAMPRLLVLILLLTGTLALAGELSTTESAKIAFLKQQLRNSNCVFDRNGSRHSGQEAIDHIEVHVQPREALPRLCPLE